MHVAIRHELVHHVSERVARSEFNNLGDPSGAARVHAGSPIHGLLDLARQFVRPLAHMEHCVTVDSAQQPDTGRRFGGQVHFV